MKVDVYAICWNEAELVEPFFKHYDQIASRYIFFDDGSTDGMKEKLASHPKAEVRPFNRVISDSYVKSAQRLHDTAWKESRGRADWVILTAIDEHLVHTNLGQYLTACTRSGVTMIPALGFQMVSETYPDRVETLAAAIPHGAPFAKMNKLCLFRPSEIVETGFAPGRHTAAPVGNIVLPAQDELLNLHFKYLGFERLRARHEVLASGLGEQDVANGWGHRYWFDAQELRSDFDFFKTHSVDLHKMGYARAARDHVTARWWRGAGRDYATADVNADLGN